MIYQHLTPDYQEKVVKRWTPVLNAIKGDIKDEYCRVSTAMVLESTQREFEAGNGRRSLLTETMSAGAGGAFGSQSPSLAGTTNDARIPTIVIPTVRRIFPALLAHDVVGVQPMNGPVGFAFAFRAKYGLYGKNNASMNGKEIGYNKMDSGFTGASGNPMPYTSTQRTAYENFVGASPWNSSLYSADVYKNGEGAGLGGSEFWSIGSDMPMAEFGMEKGVVEAKTRKLAANWSLELAEDMEKMHGVNVDAEMVNILSYEIQAEIDRQLVNEIVKAAIGGNRISTWTPVSADGRNQMERISALYTHILDKSNDVAITTRRGPANFAIGSPKVCALLERLQDFVFWNGDKLGKIDTSNIGISKVGTLRQGGINLYRDTFAGGNYILLGYKGPNPYDSGIIFCPYIPLQLMRAVGPFDFTPRLGARTRYGILNHVFGADLYYHFIAVNDLTTAALAADGGRVFLY